MNLPLNWTHISIVGYFTITIKSLGSTIEFKPRILEDQVNLDRMGRQFRFSVYFWLLGLFMICSVTIGKECNRNLLT